MISTNKKMIKKKILIKGGKVHNVGYRPFILEKAQELCIPNYYAKNIKEDGREIIEVSFGGEEKQLNEFIEFISKNYPPKAVNPEVKEDPNPPERIMSIDSYIHFLHTGQLGKIAQAGLGILDRQDQMLGKQDKTIETLGGKIDNLTYETKQGFTKTDENFSRMDTKYDRVSDKMDAIDHTLRELTKAILKLAESKTKKS